MSDSLSGERAAKRAVLCRPPISWRGVARSVDVSSDRRTAESVLNIEADDIPDAIVGLAKSKRLSIVMRNLNGDSVDRDLGWRAIRHLGFPDD